MGMQTVMSSTGTPSPPTGEPSASAPIGLLTVRLHGARDLPEQNWLFAKEAYATLCIGTQRFRSCALPGCSPCWASSFNFNVHNVDTALRIEVHRKSLLSNFTVGLDLHASADELLGCVEIPLLDLEEWSGNSIGRVLERSSPAEAAEGACMLVELSATLDWY